MSHTYYSIDTTVEVNGAVHYPTEFLNSQNPDGFPSRVLTLRVGTPIMCLRNISPPQLMDGRLVVRRLQLNSIHATILASPHRGEEVIIHRIPHITTDLLFHFKQVQFPVRLVFAMTINKPHGQTLGVARILLEEPCFSHGQLYVACSRVGTPTNMFVLAPLGKTKNIVYPQALQ